MLPHRSRALGTVRQHDKCLTAFVCIDTDHPDELWQRYGCKPYAQLADIAIVSIPKSHLSLLSEHPTVRRIEASPSAHTTMDTTAIIVGADKLYPPSTIHHLTGQGVVVGVMDIGFDLTHPNFYDSTATNYRIGAFWDQISPDTLDSPLPVGRDYVGYDAVKAQLHSYDGLIQTHGTHTLGIAAGSGYDSPYRGIAYEADICIVNNATTNDIELIDTADYDKYTTATDALGFKYIFEYAERQGKPCVASFSEGYPPYLDQEDSLFAAYLDHLVQPGRIIVAAAGNENTAMTFVDKPRGQLAAGAFIKSDGKLAVYRIKADGPVDVCLYAYADASAPTDTLRLPSSAAPILDSSHSTPHIDSLYVGADTCFILLERTPSSFDTDTVYTLHVYARQPLSSLSSIALVAEGATSHATIFGSSTYAFENRAVDPRWNGAEKGQNVHAPACFPRIVCVGATAHRLGFTNYKGVYNDYSGGRTVGHWSPYSSIGPTITGLIKPDVVAPGDNIISSYSSYYIEAKPEANDINSNVELFDFQGRTYAWNANTGTSMSTPVVAGVIALWLQANPNLTYEDIIDVLSHTCRQPDNSLSYPNCQYGYGEIDAYQGLLYLSGADRIDGVADHQPEQLRITIDNGMLHLHPTTPLIAPLQVTIYSLDGRRIHQARTTSSIPLPPLPSSVYIIQVDSNTPQLSTKQLYVKRPL